MWPTLYPHPSTLRPNVSLTPIKLRRTGGQNQTIRLFFQDAPVGPTAWLVRPLTFGHARTCNRFNSFTLCSFMRHVKTR
jgi:hypothetical protein